MYTLLFQWYNIFIYYLLLFYSELLSRKARKILFANILSLSMLLMHFCLWSGTGSKLDSANTDVYNTNEVKGLARLDWLVRLVHQSTLNELIIASLSLSLSLCTVYGSPLLLESSQSAFIPSDSPNSSPDMKITRLLWNFIYFHII